MLAILLHNDWHRPIQMSSRKENLFSHQVPTLLRQIAIVDRKHTFMIQLDNGLGVKGHSLEDKISPIVNRLPAHALRYLDFYIMVSTNFPLVFRYLNRIYVHVGPNFVFAVTFLDTFHR